MRRPPSWRHAALVIAATLIVTVCGDPGPEPVVVSIQLSVLDTTMLFREPISVHATPIGTLGFAVSRTVIWESKSPILNVVPISPDGRIVRISATGIGTGQIEASAGGQTKTLQVRVLDTVYSVVVTPSAANLVVGDTISLKASVDGPAGADTTVRWDSSATSSIRVLSSADSKVVLVQAVATGTADFAARATADMSKRGSAAISAEQGKLVFVIQPSAVVKGAAIGPAVQVAVQDGSGITSERAANAITLIGQAGSCSTAAELSAVPARTAVNGVATFSDLTMDRVSTDCKLTASADPAALPATSNAFNVTARGCEPIPYTGGTAIKVLFETTDCAVARSGGTFFPHSYSITVPPEVTNIGHRWRVNAGGDLALRMEAYLWPPAAFFRADSSASSGTISQFYVLASGTFRFTVTSGLPGTTGSYTLTSQLGNPPGVPTQGPCYFLATTPITDTNDDVRRLCPQSFQAGGSLGQRYLLYVPAGEQVLFAADPIGSGVNTHLEVFDVTDARTFLASSSGAGERNPDGEPIPTAQIVLASATTNRFIEILAGFREGSLGPFRLSISRR